MENMVKELKVSKWVLISTSADSLPENTPNTSKKSAQNVYPSPKDFDEKRLHRASIVRGGGVHILANGLSRRLHSYISSICSMGSSINGVTIYRGEGVKNCSFSGWG